MENLSKNIEAIKENQMEIIELKITTEKNSLLNGLNSRDDRECKF